MYFISHLLYGTQQVLKLCISVKSVVARSEFTKYTAYMGIIKQGDNVIRFMAIYNEVQNLS